MSLSADKIWYDDVQVLWRRWKEFFPSAQHTPAERVNALVRLILYATLAIYVYNRQARTLVVGAGAVAVVSFAFGQRISHESYPAKPSQPLVAGGATGSCTPPTKDNPFANVLLTDLKDAQRPPACPYDAVKQDITKHFNAGLFRNAADVYETENSQRQYYTMPVTTTIPDTGSFANFLYGGMTNCKEDARFCPSRM